MSDYLSTYKAELVDRYLQNQISNSEKDTLHALLLQHNRTTVTERDVFTPVNKSCYCFEQSPARVYLLHRVGYVFTRLRKSYQLRGATRIPTHNI